MSQLNRKVIESLIKEKEFELAYIKLNESIKPHSSLNNFLFAEKIYRVLVEELAFRRFRIAILRTITVEPMLPFIKVMCYANKINPELYLGGYNIIDQGILDQGSKLYAFKPDALIIFWRAEEVCPKLMDSYLELSSNEVVMVKESVVAKIDKLISAFRTNSEGKIIVHNFELPQFPVFGIVDSQHKRSQKGLFEELNNLLIETTNKYVDVYVLDYEHLVSRYGKRNWFDERLWFTAKAPLSIVAMQALANEYTKYFKAMLGMTKKCIVLDLDNTLWGGILGEEGIQGIKIGQASPGNAFTELQKELLKLYHKGFVLAINSKNDEEAVMEVFDKHPDMVLRKKHFASMKINWTNKAQNMKDIAEELNIGLDTFVFLDDSPVERELIKQQLPEVHCVALPNNAHLYPKILRELPDFERLSFTEEDLRRGEMYKTQIKRKKLEKSSTSLEDFYSSLEMVAIVRVNDSFEVSRLADMTQKTNQFNLTTRRYSKSDISRFITSRNYQVYSLRLIDKFGDNGVVGSIIVKQDNDIWELYGFWLSCRVMGRTVETAFLSYICEKGLKDNIKSILGKYVPSKRNSPVKDLYKEHGFRLVKKDKGITSWKLDRKKTSIKCPRWIAIREG